MSSPPVIGITAYEEKAAWNDWSSTAAVLPSSYLRRIEASGAIPVVIPVQELSAQRAVVLVGRLDGLVVSGGPDVSPGRYGATAHPLTSEQSDSRLQRDALESCLLETAFDTRCPTLGICRGLQLLNVQRGGSLHQHLPEVVGHDGHVPAEGDFGRHDVSVQASSRLAEVLGWTRSEVPTHHHQAVDQLGEGLTAVAFADDGTIEAVEDERRGFFLAVQWHPEVSGDPSLFDGLARAARSTR
ncbi:MAG: gamma-glutamyl-gamma-aminobutyrate hydrolase family protein [Acidimicrobiales bacterium]